MKLKQLGGMALLAAATLLGQTAFADVVQITDADLTAAGATINWSRTNTYVLNGYCFVKQGQTLNIEAGTIIKGKDGAPGVFGALFVTRGAKIFALGTPQQPIIFTAEVDNIGTANPWPNLGITQRALWGGIVLYGQATLNTPSDAGGAAANPKYDVFEGLPDTIINGQNVHRFGGTDDNDNSGVMRYVSIRHGGKVLESNKEINGLSICAVGRGTTLEFIEAFAIADDGFEFFGGTVNTRYLVSAFNDDDAFDADQGHRGKHQFWFSIQSPDARDKGFELNGEPNGIATGASPIANFTVYNATSIGAGVGSGGANNNVFTVREYAAPKVFNSIFTDYAQRGISIDAKSGLHLTNGILKFENNIWFGFTAGNTIANLDLGGADLIFSDTTRSNLIVDPLLGGISRTNNRALDPRPQAASPARTGLAKPVSPDGFLTPVNFVGAFGDQNWAADWTALSAYGVLTTAGAATPSGPTSVIAFSAGDATSTGVTLWARALDTNAPGATQLLAQLSTDSTFATGVTSALVAPVATNDYTAKLQVSALTPATRYYYRFTDGVNTSGTGTFKTAPAANTAAQVRFAFSGDNDGLMRPYALASTLPGQALDFYINLGDTIYENASNLTNGNNGASYLNSPSVTLSGSSLSLNGVPVAGTTFATRQQLFDDYSKKYRENFLPVNVGGQGGLQSLYAGQGVYTLYDNHELGNRQYINGGAPAGGSVGGASGTDMATGRGVDARDNGAGNVGNTNDINTSSSDYMNRSPGFVTLQQVYLNYQPIADRGLVNNPADPRSHGTKQLYYAQQWGKNVLFVNVDDRTYRDLRLKTATGSADDTGTRADNPNRTMLGATQLAWLKQTLLNAQASGIIWKFVAVSDPIDQIGPIGGSLTGIVNSSGNGSYSPVNSDGGKAWVGGYRAERNDLLKFIADNGIKNVVFMATDDHQNRINELTYSPSGLTGTQASYVKVPYCFSIVAGPLGATGPDAFFNHDFASIKTMADSFVTAQAAAGVEPFGLQGYPGLRNVAREGDANAGTTPSAVDFYSPDSFNYATLDVSADGKTLTVATLGITATAQNSALEYNPATNAVRQILSFQVPAATDPAPVVANQGGAVTLSVNDLGAGTTYQWLRNGSVVAGATNASLQLNNLIGDRGTNHMGPSTIVPPVLDSLHPNYSFQALFSAGETVNNKADGVTPYRMVGIPDGLGAFDNSNGTFTLLMNQELGSTVGITRTHGGKGAFVSRWLIAKSNLTVLNISDLITNVFLWDTNGNTYTNSTNFAFARFCSADLPAISAYYNPTTGLGTTNRIFMNGEESSKESKAWAHIVTGPDAGKTYELPHLGKIAWENALANPFPQNKTIVGCDDDSTVSNSRVHFYVGTKSNTGLDIDKAGLTGGTLYGVKLNGFTTETDAAVPTNGTAFSLFSYGNVANLTGAQIDALAVANSVAAFQRVEDGTWDPAHPTDYYFVTTASFTGKSRLWRLRFTDIANPENGGTIDLLMNGNEGQKMFDNISFDADGNLVLLEDPGNQAYVARVWKYIPATGASFPIATFRPSLFTPGQPGFLTQDEETSGIIDVSSILGYKAMLLVAQIHTTNGIPSSASTTEIVENGQLLLMRQVDTGNYSVIVSNSFGVSTSSVAGLTVTAPPEFAHTTFHGGLPGATVSNGGTLTLNVPASALTGTGPFTYQWFLNGVPIANANNSTLTVPGFNSTFAGNYTVQVSNAAGSTTSIAVPVSTADIAFFGGVTIDGPANAKYRLEFLADVTNTNSWTSLTNITHSGGRQFYIDTTSSGTQRRFFRAVPTP